jgi:hypothetical protein
VGGQHPSAYDRPDHTHHETCDRRLIPRGLAREENVGAYDIARLHKTVS